MEEDMNIEHESGLVAYRLGRVEKAVEKVEQNNTEQNERLMAKLESFGEIRTQVMKNSIKIESLEKSRDKLIASVAGLGTGLLLLLIQQVLKYI